MAESAELDMQDTQPEGETQAQPALDPMHLRIVEALLFASEEPIDEQSLAKALPGGTDIRGLLAELQRQYEPRGDNLITTPGMPPSRTIRLEPTPTVVTGMSGGSRERKYARSSASTGVNSACAGPPTRNQVSGASGSLASSRPRSCGIAACSSGVMSGKLMITPVLSIRPAAHRPTA